MPHSRYLRKAWRTQGLGVWWSPWPLRLTLEVGPHVPLHCTTSGKLFLACLPMARRNTLLGALRLEALTRDSMTDARVLQPTCARLAAAQPPSGGQ